MKLVIASDFHLKYNENQEDIKRRLRVSYFLKSLTNNTDMLILNGDIFDLWIDWSFVIIKDYFPFLKILADLSENGCRIIYISGNHDFWFGEFLNKYIGIEIFQDYFEETIEGKRFYVTHGDLNTINDLRYHVFRKIIRSSIIKFIAKAIHPNISLKLGKLLSRSSRNREYPADLQEKKEQGLLQSAEKLINKYDYIIMGHSHLPKIVKINNGFYINCGDWLIHNSYCVFENQTLELKYFDEKIKEQR